MSTQPFSIRSLAYSDLPQVIAIERRAFPTPWSLAMFVLELSKPSGVCLAAVDAGDLVGYLVCARYDQVWHLMNVAVDPRARRRGLARRLLATMLERAGLEASYTLGVRTSNAPAITLYEQLRFPRRRQAPALLPGHRRGCPDHVADRRHDLYFRRRRLAERRP